MFAHPHLNWPIEPQSNLLDGKTHVQQETITWYSSSHKYSLQLGICPPLNYAAATGGQKKDSPIAVIDWDSQVYALPCYVDCCTFIRKATDPGDRRGRPGLKST